MDFMSVNLIAVWIQILHLDEYADRITGTTCDCIRKNTAASSLDYAARWQPTSTVRPLLAIAKMSTSRQSE